MTPREIVLANITWDDPPRPAFNFTGGGRRNDFVGGGVGKSPDWQPRRWIEDGREYYDDEWGNLWVRLVGGPTSGEVHTPAITDFAQLDSYRPPDFSDDRRYEPLRETFSHPTDRFRLAFVPGWVFATSRYLRKMETYFPDLIENRAQIDRLHEIVTDAFATAIDRIGACGADGIFFCEDLGVQDRPLIGPEMWRDVFKPRYRRLTGVAHDHGMKVLQHSCGYNWALIDDLADAGIDCFQFDQPHAYDMAALAAKLRELGCGLWSPVDIQQVLPTGDRERIEAEARRMVELFGGGLICKNYPDLPSIGVEPQWDAWAYEALCDAAGVEAYAEDG